MQEASAMVYIDVTVNENQLTSKQDNHYNILVFPPLLTLMPD
jgi:hypothetical protein